VIEAVIQAGATTINLPDTVGYSTPNDIAHFFRTVRAKVNAPAHIVYSAHCHDDLGLAVARTRRSSAAMPSRTKRASIRTAF
jgi:2-isopropylmalate synthase